MTDVVASMTIPQLQGLFQETIRQELARVQSDRKPAQQPHSLSEELVTVDELAAVLRLSRNSIYGMIQRKEINFVKRAKRCYFKREDVLTYLEKGRRLTQEEINARAAELSTKKKRG